MLIYVDYFVEFKHSILEHKMPQPPTPKYCNLHFPVRTLLTKAFPRNISLNSSIHEVVCRFAFHLKVLPTQDIVCLVYSNPWLPPTHKLADLRNPVERCNTIHTMPELPIIPEALCSRQSFKWLSCLHNRPQDWPLDRMIPISTHSKCIVRKTV